MAASAVGVQSPDPDGTGAVKRRSARVRAAAAGLAMVGGSLLLVLLVEGVGLLVPRRDRPPDNLWALSDAYAGRAEVEEMYREWWLAYRSQWKPYVHWQRAPFHGRTIQVDALGVRRTWRDPRLDDDRQSERALRIWMFGGSALWGTGARDLYTIPSVVARDLAARGILAEVINLGETGYVSTQEVVALFRRLQRHERPDAVVFYDGANDIASVALGQEAGLPLNSHNRVEEFNLLQPERYDDLSRAYWRRWWQRRGMVRLAEWLRRFGKTAGDDSQVSPPKEVPPQLHANVESAVALYQENLRLVRQLAEANGFEVLFFWQPVIFDKSPLSLSEEARRREVAIFAPAFEIAKELRRSASPLTTAQDFTDLSHILSSEGESFFLDWCHVSEEANAILGAAMADRIARRLALETRDR